MSLSAREILQARIERIFRMAAVSEDTAAAVERVLTMMDEIAGTGVVAAEPPPDKIIQLLDSGLVLTQAGAVYTSVLDVRAPRSILTLSPVTIQVEEDDAPA